MRVIRAIKEELIEYCNNCINDLFVSEYEDYISCVKHKQACKRLLMDFQKENSQEFLYYWDEEEAKKIVNWFTYLRHSKGELANTPIYLTVWQKFFVCQIYGWRNVETKRRRFTKSFVECARKQAKSQMEAGICLHEMSVTPIKNNELTENYMTGTRREQSKIIFDEMKLMLIGSPLATKFKITRDKIIHIKSGSFAKPLSKEDKKSGDGSNINLLILDEYHQHETTEFYDLFQGANSKESLLMIITTAGVNINSPCFTQEYKYCSNILNGVVENDTYFVDILEIDVNDDINDMRNWWKANPIRMSYPEGVKKLREAYEVAKAIPEKMTSFLQKCLDQWQNKAQNGYMNMDKFKKCIVKEIPYDLKGNDVYIGIDVSSKTDLTAVTFEFPILEGETLKFAIKNHSFIPNEEKLMEHIKVDKMPFEMWVREGYITITNTPIVDQKQVIDYCLNMCESNGWNIRAWAIDPFNASLLTTTLLDLGEEVFEIYQSKKHLNEPTVDFREQVYSENVIVEENLCYLWQMSNARVIESDGLIKIDKYKQKERIDNVDSTICSHKLCMYWKPPEPTLEERLLSGDYFC